jgi:phage RecT family recombinase
MNNQIAVVKKALGRGGVVCKDFNRVKLNEHMDWKTEQAYALEIIQNNKSFGRCTATSIGRSLVDLSIMGLTLSPAMRLAYLIPYGESCTASPSYMGLEQIAYRSGMVEGIQCGVVRKGDEFREWTDERGKHLDHQVKPNNTGEITHSYCIAWLVSGRTLIEVMDKAALMACRDAAAKKNNNEVPWTWKGPFREEMYKKAALRRGWKHWPKVSDPRLSRMMEAVDRTDPMEFSKHDARVIDDETTLSQPQLNGLIEMMKEAQFPDRGVNAQLQGLASKLGYPKGIRSVLIKDYDAAASLMEAGLKRWKEATSQTSEPSDSEPVDSTAQEAVT